MSWVFVKNGVFFFGWISWREEEESIHFGFILAAEGGFQIKILIISGF